jgi:DNA-binding IclR family transcriptional regulator
MTIGRPPLQMTRRRLDVLHEYTQAIEAGERISLAELARRCGISDYNSARRILNDLKRMGRIVD